MKFKYLFLALSVSMLLASTATAQTLPSGMSVDNDYQSGQTGYYYVNMPSEYGATTKITLPTGFLSSFKVYDDGGKNGNYTSDSYCFLELTAPANCLLRLSGNVTTNGKHDKLEVYDGRFKSNLLGTIYSETSGVLTDFEPIVSTQQTMTLVFSSYKSCAGLDLTVTVVQLTNHEISVNAVTGGTVTVDKNSAIANETVTLTATPSEGYLFNRIIVSDGSNTYVSGGDWVTNTATFTMPNTDVTVTPVFTNNNWTADEGLFVSMFDSKDLVANIPIGMQSFKVMYGDGSSKTASKTNATLKLAAPEGYVLQLSGTLSIDLGSYDKSNEEAEFVVYDGESTSASSLIKYSTNMEDYVNKPIEVLSTGKEVYIRCHTGYSATAWNLNLTVTLTPIDGQHFVIVSNSISNGGIVADQTAAKPNSTVNLTVTPDEGYVLKSINVTDANGNIQLTPSSPNASFGDVNYFTASNFSFTMRTADATVSATFMPKTDFYVTIPKTGDRTFSIPDGTTSFNVYAEKYDFNDNGYLLLTAPQGFKMKVSGRAYIFRWSSMIDYLEIFDGATSESTSLGKFWESTNASDPNYTQKDGVGVPVNATSSGNKLLFYFYSNYNGYTEKGLNLTVTLIDARKSVQDLTVTIPAQTYTGSAIEPEITVKDGSKTLVQGTDYTVAYSNNINVGTATATITGKGNYSGTVEKTFTITPKVTTLGALTLTEYGDRTTATLQGEFTSTEKTSLEIDNSIDVSELTFQRTFTAGVPATVMLPFSFAADKVDGKFYTLASVAPINGVWTATMSNPIKGIIEANTPYIFKANSNLTKLTFENGDDGVTLQSTKTINDNGSGDWTL
ncbi:MAG: hypothetical protein PUC50_13280, partial [Bacteroidales bacterium]|nr:hypothetical protein [Bacteroidales bacterium]